MAESCPRLLVATEFPPNAAGGGAAIVRQMLQGWPVENLYWWSCVPEVDRRFGQSVAAHAVAGIPPRLYPHRRWSRQKSWLLETVWAPWAARHFRQTLAAFNPDVVWVIPHGWSIFPLARVLPGAGIRYHVSIHDYPDVQGHVARMGSARCRRLAERVDHLYAQAATRDAICQPMVEDLRARTGAPGIVNRAGLEPQDLAGLATTPALPPGPIRIAYPGTILVEPEFALFVAALAGIRPQLPQPVSLDFFGNHSYYDRTWFDPAWMHEHGNLPAKELLAELKKCTWGFAPMGLTDDDPRYNHFSLPTKFVSYLQAGLPIIALGNPQCSVMRTMAGFHLGLSRTDGDLDAFRRELLAALSQPNPRAEFGTDLERLARAGFDAQQMRQALWAGFRRPDESPQAQCNNQNSPAAIHETKA